MARSILSLRSVAAILASSFLAAIACAQSTPAASAASDCSDFPCGRVEAIQQVTVKENWTPLGTTGTMSPGGNTGAVTTSFEFGPGMSKKGMVLQGAAGGAVYRKSPNAYERAQWQVTVKLDSGRTRVLTIAYEPYVREGDRVRVAGNNLERLD